MRLSARTSWELGENAFAAAVRTARERGGLIDLTRSNPTECGFSYDPLLLEPMAQAAALQYQPAPFGMQPARAAVSAYYAEHGAQIDPREVCLTTSTSEAYSFLFSVLCDPGDEVLVSRPSYPLFEFIATLTGVRLREYPLRYDGRWEIDLEALRAVVSDRTRAVLVVHPNNPTGQYASAAERDALRTFCAEHGLALIVDEVFLDFALGGSAQPSFTAEASPVPTFVLSGISKVCGLPQMKCSWIALHGAGMERAEERLEMVADTFLSLSGPIQHALPHWLSCRGPFQAEVRARIAENLAALRAHVGGFHANLLEQDGGWTAVLRVPRTVDGEEFALWGLGRGVLVQPGEFYGLPEGRIVLSLLTPTAELGEGLQRLRL